MSAREEFIKATFRLAKAAPHDWAEFYSRFDAYTLAELEQGISTSSAEMAISLGMGRRMVNLRNDFRDIERLADKINGR